MTDITGTNTGETLNGTGDADTIQALGGNDTVNAGAGNDTIYGGTGNDTLNGDDGDDTFIENEFTTPTDIFNGGIGFDTIELRAAPFPIQTNLGALTPHSLNGTGQMSSIERIVFASQAGQIVQATLSYANWQAAGITQIVGGAGRDILTISNGNVAGTYTMPTLPLSSWDAAPVNAWEHTGDIVVLSAGTTASSVTLNALAGASFFQVLAGGNGNDFLNGSDNADSINASSGADTVNAGGGNDTITIVNSGAPNGVGWNPPTSFTGAGGSWNGGSGTDVISIGGAVNLQATLVSIEGVQLQAAFFPSVPNTGRQEAAVLTLDSAHIAMLPGNAFFTGTGTVVFNLNDGVGLAGANYVITPGSTVSFEINAGIGDGLLFSGSSGSDAIFLGEGVQTAIGGDGDDFIAFGIGDQTAIGGTGSDHFRIGPGIGGILDFTVGTDKIDMFDTGITLMSRFNDLSFIDTPAGATLSGSTGGINFQMVLHGVSRASVSAGDIVLSSDNYANVEFGTGFNDLLFGFALNDQLHGGGNNDRLYGGGGVDQLFGDDGNDVLILDGETLSGGVYDGGTGTDTLLLRNYVGNNPIGQFGPGSTHNLLGPTPVASIERVQFDSLVGTQVTMLMAATNLATSGITEVTGGAGTDVLVGLVFAGGVYTMPNFTLTSFNGNDALVLSTVAGTLADVTLNAAALNVIQVLVGASGNDTLNGAIGNDILIGDAGNDTLNGGAGINTMTGGTGNDRLVLAAGSDGSTVDGGTESDTLAVSGSVGSLASLIGIEAVELIGGANLTLTGSQFNTGLAANTVLSGTGTITINMESGLNVITSLFSLAGGSSVGLIINGSTGVDVVKVALGTAITVHGGDGTDQLRGGNLVDTIFGDGGNDKIIGLGGADQLTGGAGVDQFRYLFTTDTGMGANADSVLDFAIGTDKLDFRGLDANAGVAGRQALSFVGSGAFVANGIGQVRYETAGGDLLVSIDYNGDGSADAQIVLVGDGGQTLTGTDFLF